MKVTYRAYQVDEKGMIAYLKTEAYYGSKGEAAEFDSKEACIAALPCW